MKILVGDTRSRKIIAFLCEHGWGRMLAEERPVNLYPYEPWGFDNGAFESWKARKPFPEASFLRRLSVALKFNSDPILAVCPDIVAGGLKSLEFSVRWREKLPSWPWYLAVQDPEPGTENEYREAVVEVAHLFPGIFLGGTDKFKLQAYRWSRLAHHCDKKFHYGRAGTLRKLAHAHAVEADSVDSNLPLWTNERMLSFRDHKAALESREQGILPCVT